MSYPEEFLANFPAMQEMAGRLESGREEIGGVLTAMQGKVEGMTQTDFRSAVASPTYNTAYTEMTTSLNKAIVAIDEMANTLKGIVGNIQEFDQGLVKRG